MKIARWSTHKLVLRNLFFQWFIFDYTILFFSRTHFFGVCKNGLSSMNRKAIWSEDLSSVFRIRFTSHFLNISQVLFCTDCFLPCVWRGVLITTIVSESWCVLTNLLFACPSEHRYAIKYIIKTKRNDLRESMKEVGKSMQQSYKNSTMAALTSSSSLALQKGDATLCGESWRPGIHSKFILEALRQTGSTLIQGKELPLAAGAHQRCTCSCASFGLM